MVELTNADDCPLSDLDDTASTSSLEPESSDKFILKIGMISSDGTVKYDSFKTIDWSCSTQMSSPPLVDTSPSLAAKIQFVYHLEDTEEPYRIVFIGKHKQVDNPIAKVLTKRSK